MTACVLITIVDGFHYRYLVQTGIFDRILNSSGRLLVCGTEEVISRMRAERPKCSLDFHVISIAKSSFWTSVHLFLRSCDSRRLSETLNIKSELLKQNTPFRYCLRRALASLTGRLHVDLSRAFEFAWKDDRVHQLIRDNSVQLVVLSTPGQKLEDLPYLYSAKHLGITTVSPVYSWDNLTAKGPFVIPPTRLVVWNEVMKEEACFYHNYQKEDVMVGGVPVFDPYSDVAEHTNEVERQAFCSRLGLDPQKKLITLTTIPPVYYGSCHQLLGNLIKGWLANGSLRNASLLIRPHPMDSTDYSALVGLDVVVDNYGSKPNVDPKRWRPTEDNTHHLGRTMAFSDVVINIASTITVDAACFDTPTINIAFDMKSTENEYFGSVARYYKYSHYRQVVETKAACIVYSAEQLLESIQRYLNNPGLDRLGRAELVRKQVGQIDGRAAEKTADAIMSALNS